jgi:hypothetical protein
VTRTIWKLAQHLWVLNRKIIIIIIIIISHVTMNRAAVEFTRSSTAPFIGCFLIRTSNPDSVPSITDLTSCFAMLYYVLDAQLFLGPQLLPHIEQSVETSIVTVETWVWRRWCLWKPGCDQFNHSIMLGASWETYYYYHYHYYYSCYKLYEGHWLLHTWNKPCF